ncbi:MAG: hypothetical protein Q7T19_11775 [Caulobacter sp.]|nr:hypothetical protein [Caulobacter sp.]
MKREIVELIERTVREQFAGVKIESVGVSEDTDYDGEMVYRVRVVFDQKGPLDSHKTSAIARHLRHKLVARQENAFPIVAFVSKSDAMGQKAAAA